MKLVGDQSLFSTAYAWRKTIEDKNLSGPDTIYPIQLTDEMENATDAFNLTQQRVLLDELILLWTRRVRHQIHNL